MSFRGLDFDHLAKFNSAVSSDFLQEYEDYVDNMLINESKEPSHRTFAPSAFRCDRRSWFRLRGVEPDEIKVPDRVLDFSSQIGTACHRMIQRNLRDMLKENWINVEDYVNDSVKDLSTRYVKYEYCTPDDENLETLISIVDPPVRFACDGIVRLDGIYYLLEIKSSEYASWNDLTDPKPQHIDQVNCYCTLLDLDKVLFLYIDRQYGGLKCFEHSVTDYVKAQVSMKFEYVQKMVESNLAPVALPKGDPWCTPSMCPYYKKCSEYGR